MPDSGIEYHRYGSHLFHTNSEEVWEYLQPLTTFTNYRHRVLTIHQGQVYSMPINLGTMCAFFGRYMSPDEARAVVKSQVESAQTTAPRNLEEKAISLIGRPLYEAFIKGYTKKQWQTDPRQLPPGIITRLPVRFNFEPYYFADRHEGVPTDGYNGDLPETDRLAAHRRPAGRRFPGRPPPASPASPGDLQRRHRPVFRLSAG